MFHNVHLVNLGLKGGISIDADSGSLGYVFWCCGSRSWEVPTFFQNGSGHAVLKYITTYLGSYNMRMRIKVYGSFDVKKLSLNFLNCGNVDCSKKKPTTVVNLAYLLVEYVFFSQ